MQKTAHYHLPGLFEFYDFYKEFLKLFHEHREYFFDWCDIGSIYGASADCLWGGGRVGFGDADPEEVISLLNEYNISARLTFSNSLINEAHLSDSRCNRLCKLFSDKAVVPTGIIIYSDILLEYIKKNYPGLYFVSSTTKVITDFDEMLSEVRRGDFSYTVPDFRLNKEFDKFKLLTDDEKAKIEFLINECCYPGCVDRKACYENVSRKSLGENVSDHVCRAPGGEDGYRFSKAMKNPSFISRDDIVKIYMPMGFSNFKIEGRSLGSAVLLEFILYYMTKPEHQLEVREELYLDSMLDLF